MNSNFPSQSRRRFLASLLAVGWGSVWARPRFGVAAFPDDDETICRRTFELALELRLHERPVGEIVLAVGRSFLGTPYLAHALEVPGEERLVVNLRGLDCVSFCENAIVIARCVRKQELSFDEYRKELQFIRYRGGIIDRYPSRLHYFTDWIHDNQVKNVVEDVTRSIGGRKYSKRIDFMSTHPSSYRQLVDQPRFIKEIRKQEETISSRTMYSIPKNDLAEREKGIRDGDILAITTTIEGLDVSHTGIAVMHNGRLHMMHAPDVGTTVSITDRPLADVLAKNKRQSGVVVARPVEPEA